MKKIQICMTRDSVCAADDINSPHKKSIFAHENATIEDIIMSIYDSKYIPSNIQGGEATWSIASKIPLAVIAQQWSKPKIVSLPPTALDELDSVDQTLKVHISYYAQIDPNIVFEVLDTLRLTIEE